MQVVDGIRQIHMFRIENVEWTSDEQSIVSSLSRPFSALFHSFARHDSKSSPVMIVHHLKCKLPGVESL